MNMNNNKKDAKTAYRPYGYAIGKNCVYPYFLLCIVALPFQNSSKFHSRDISFLPFFHTDGGHACQSPRMGQVRRAEALDRASSTLLTWLKRVLNWGAFMGWEEERVEYRNERNTKSRILHEVSRCSVGCVYVGRCFRSATATFLHVGPCLS